MLLAAACLTLLVGCGGGKKSVSPTASQPAATATEAPSAASGPATFHVLAGEADGPYDIEQFMPGTIRIREGDSVTWTAHGDEGHTISFFPDGKINIGIADYLVPAEDTPGTREFNPVYAIGSEAQGSYDGTEYVNSGFLGVPAAQDYTLDFPTAGVYAYLCMIHPLNMRGVVVVEQSDAQVPAPEAVGAEGQRFLQRYKDEAEGISAAARADRESQNQAASGGAWNVSVGLDTPHAQVLAFVPSKLQIETGQHVVFWNSDRDFHNVVFVPEGQEAPQFPIIKPVEGRTGFRLLINPAAEHEIPAPPDVGPGTLFSSGLMGIGFPRFYYEVTFMQPGTYRFFCTVHTLAGMAGTIEVR